MPIFRGILGKDGRKVRVEFDEGAGEHLDDPEHSENEHRYILIGSPRQDSLLVVSYTFRGERARIINARPATPAEKRRYMNEDLSEIRDEDDFMRDEYDFSTGIRGLHYFGPRGLVLRIPIDPDLQPYFHDTRAVNDALRMLVAEGRHPKIESDEITDPDAEIDLES